MIPDLYKAVIDMCSGDIAQDGQVDTNRLLRIMAREVMNMDNLTWQRNLMDACAITLIYKASRDEISRERLSSIVAQKWRHLFQDDQEAEERSHSPVSVVEI